MNEFHPERLKKLLIRIATYILLGLAYYAFIKLTGLKIPCVSYTVFHFHCPGCGLTRMCVALIEGNISLAFRQNAFAFCLLPLFLVWATYNGYCYVFNKEQNPTWWEKVIIVVVFVTAIVFSVLRNLPQFEILAPIPW